MIKLEKRISKYILEESTKLIERFNQYHNVVHQEYERNRKRLGSNCPPKVIHKPEYWNHDQKFDPFYVKKKRESIAKSIAKKLQTHTYKPNKHFPLQVKKPDGSSRTVHIYQIQDAAISKMYYDGLLSKNKHRFSSFSYAYRNDRNVHFAIQDISIDFKDNYRMFVAEFDFSKFFPSILHTYLKDQFVKNGFNINPNEREIINSFLDGYNNERGIPQGTSLSLFLANLACWSLDKQLETLGVKFARYADDTVIWSNDYVRICQACNIINDFAKISGVEINPKKSNGVSLITRDKHTHLAEMKQISFITFLGYQLSIDFVSIKQESVKKIQREISFILYKHLIQPFKNIKPTQNMSTISAIASSIMQIRRYLYGSMSDKQLRDYVAGRINKIYFKGIMTFYPLVNDEAQLKQLDGWMLATIYRAIKLHKIILSKSSIKTDYKGALLGKEKFLQECRLKEVKSKICNEIPSFLRIYKAIQKGINDYGIERIMNPQSLYYDY